MSILLPMIRDRVAGAAGQGADRGKVLALRPRAQEAELHAFVDDQLHPMAFNRVHAYLAQHPEQLERLETVHRQKLALRILFAHPAAPMPIPLACLGQELERSISLSFARHLAFKAMLLVGGLLAVGLILWSACD